MTTILQLRDVNVRFRVRSTLNAVINGDRDPFIDAVAGVSLDMAAGETFALVGESGSGKTTLARAITGLVDVHSGSIQFEGNELFGLSDFKRKKYRRHISMMFQDPIGSLSPRLTVRSLLIEPFQVHGMKDRDLNAECKRLLEMVGLPADFSSRYPHQLSGGQARRVGVARALAIDPKLIVADEPTAGLDVSVQGEILNLLNRLQDRLGVGILIITHNLNIVRHIAHRTAIMYLGRFVENGPTQDIFAHAHHPYTKALLSANPEPTPGATIERLELQGEVPSLKKRPQGCEFHPRCPYVKDDCKITFPAKSTSGEGHYITCHYPLND